MAINKSEKKRIKLDAKKIGRILSFVLLTIALLMGIIWSSIKVNTNMIYGPEYNGAYQASVQVIEPKDGSGDDLSLSELAGSLSDKLAPFSDKSITVTKTGKDHLTVMVGKQDYESNETYLRNQIQSNGGLFMLSKDSNGQLQDFYSTAKDAKKDSKRFKSGDFFNSKVTTKTLSNGSGRDSFVQIGLNGDTFANTLADEVKSDDTNGQQNVLNFAAGDQQQIPSLYFASGLQEMIDTLRFFYVVNNNPNAVDVYYNDIIQPIQQKVYPNAKTDAEKEILRNLFGGTITWKEPGSNLTRTQKVSLLDTSFNESVLYDHYSPELTGINSEQDLKTALTMFTPNTDAMPTSNFIYDPDAALNTIDGSNKSNLFKDWFTSNQVGGDDVNKLTKQQVFQYTINDFLNDNVLFSTGMNVNNADKKKTGITPNINPDLASLAPQLSNNILFAGGVSPSTKNDGVDTSISGEVSRNISFIVDNAKSLRQDTSSIQNGFYLRTKNITAAKKAVASIKQNALGVSYLVESITSVNPYITSVMYIASIVFLSIIALLLAIYILFVYRLLGLFTIIIAACSVAIVLLAASGFGIGMGPQVIAALFLIIALIMDTSFILFEGWKENYYEKKHGILSSFKIGNKETLSMAADAILVAFIPNIVLFWVANGPLKTFGTLSIIGVGLAVVCGIIIGRFIYWLILKAKFVQKTDWLLPMDTRYTSLETLRDEFAINKYTNFLENHEGKNKYTTKELEQINKAKQQLELAQKSYHKHLIVNNAKVTARDDRTIKYVKKSTAFLTKLKNWVIKVFRIKHPSKNLIVRMIDGRLEDDAVVLGVDKEVETSDSPNKSKLRDKGKVVRSDRMVSRGMFFLMIGLLIVGVIAAIVGGVCGVRWANNVGYGQQFVVYGDDVTKIQQNIGGNKFSLGDGEVANKWKQITDYYEQKIDKLQSNSSDYESQKQQYYAYEIKDFLQYLNDEDLFDSVGQKSYTKYIKLGKAKFDVIVNYHHEGTSTPGKDLVALRINSTATDKKSRSEMKRLLVAMEMGQWPNESTMDSDNAPYNSPDGGIAAYDISPYTVSKQIRNVGIAFGIALAVLVAYIFIRFKWTYYVALALGLGLVIGVVVALIAICRVPMSTELLCGMVFVITFALTSMVLVLGKGKAKLNLENKENVKKNFSGSIKLSADMRAKKAETQGVYVPMRKKLQHLWWQIVKLKCMRVVHRNTFNQYEELEDLIKQHGVLKNDYKAAHKEQTHIYKAFKDDAKRKQNELQRKNWYFKEVFHTLIKYSAWRMATLGVFYLLVGIILAATLPSIFGMGLTIVFGLIAGFSIALFFAVPVWVYFEKRRIRFAYGRKKYIESLKVSNEEEIVKGIND